MEGVVKYLNNVIILARMYVGKYLIENIGHEVINLFKSDNGNNYIYVPHDGKINPKYNNSVNAVILVRYLESGIMEIVAKAEELEQVLFKTGNIDEEAASQIDYINENKVTYGGVPVYRIYHGSNAEKITITYKCNKLRLPKAPLYLIEDFSKKDLYSPNILLPEKHFSSQSLKMYYTQSDFPKDYFALTEMLLSEKYWETENTTQKIDINEYSYISKKNSFLSIIKKEYDEIIFSNMLAYFFEQNPDVFENFARTILGIDSFSKKYIIKREFHNIDIWIEDSDNVVIIENKIKSKINGEQHTEFEEKINSQLKKYYDIAVNECVNKNISCYLFTPDYNYINLEKYVLGEKYKLIKYSEIYNFYKIKAGDMLHISYFSDFLNALFIHTKTVDNSNYDIMKERFIDKIKKIVET